MPAAALAGIDITWRERGAGDVLLLLHGFPFDASLWDPQLAALPPGWRGVAPDLRGFGGTRPHQPTDAFEIEQYARDALALLDHLGAPRAVVCGLSMGGYVALALQRLAPARVQGLVLADTRAEPDSEEAAAQRLQQAAEVREQGSAAFIEGMLPKLLSDDTFAQRPDVVAAVRAMMERASADAIARALAGLAARPDARPQLAAIAVPTLVIGGREDRITPAETLASLAAGIPGARLELIPRAGHVANLEAANAFNAALHKFLAGV